MERATLNEPIPLEVVASDGRTDLYARVRLYQGSTLITTLPLPHQANGKYGDEYTFTAEGYYSAVYQLFEDSGFTTPASYDLESELIECSSDKTNIMRLLGLAHENTVFDLQTYDSAGCLTSGRLRVFKTKADALAENVSAILFTYTIIATYTSGQLSKYLITRDS